VALKTGLDVFGDVGRSDGFVQWSAFVDQLESCSQAEFVASASQKDEILWRFLLLR